MIHSRNYIRRVDTMRHAIALMARIALAFLLLLGVGIFFIWEHNGFFLHRLPDLGTLYKSKGL